MRSLAEIIISMPAVASSTSTGYSNFSARDLAHVVERQDQRRRRGDEGEHLHEAGEAVDHEGAVEQLVRARRLLQDEPGRHARGRATASQPIASASASRSGRNTPSISSAIARADQQKLGIERPVGLELVHGSRPSVRVEQMCTVSSRHLSPGSSRPLAPALAVGWMPGTSPGMTSMNARSASWRYRTFIAAAARSAAS